MYAVAMTAARNNGEALVTKYFMVVLSVKDKDLMMLLSTCREPIFVSIDAWILMRHLVAW